MGAEYELSVSVEMQVPAGCYTDDITDTLSYADLHEVVKREFDRPSRLIEHVATRIGRAIMDGFPAVRRSGVRLVKVAPPIPGFSGSAAVEIFFEK